MSKSTIIESYQIIWLIRRLFRALSQKSGESLEKFGITVAERAVMEFLSLDKSLSVPEIAAQYNVSRQHVQLTVNTLLSKALIATLDNPRHKRSPLYKLNASGKKLFDAILKQDEDAVDVLFSEVSQSNRKITQETLQQLLNEINRV